MVGYLKTLHDFDVLIDDDRAGEAADLVGSYVRTVTKGDFTVSCSQ
jgi:hypothetical protein